MKKITSTLFMVMLIVNAFASGHTVTITSTNASCNGLCNGTATVIVNGGIGPFEYSWSPSRGTAAMANNLCAGAYTVTVTDSSDMSIATGSVTLTQSASPTLTNTTLTQTICSSDIVSIILTSNIPGTTFSWTGSASSGITGFTTVGNGNISDMISATGPSGTVTYIITPTGPAPSFCPGTPVNYVVTVNPKPTVTNTPLTQTICSGGNATMVPASNVTGTTFSWTTSSSSGSITGFSANGTGNISELLTNSGTTPGTVTYIITPTANGCPGTPVNQVFTVYPRPTVTNTPLTQTICSGAAFLFTPTSTIAGTTFSWTASASSGSITGYSANGTGIISQVINNSGASGTVTYIITPVGPAPSFCPGNPVSFVVTITPAITTTPSLPDTICRGGSTQIYAAGYGGNLPYTYTYLPAMTPPGPPYTVTPTTTTPYTVYATDANGCVSPPQTITIYVSPVPHANFTMVPDSTNGLNYYAFNTTTGNNLTYSWDFGDGTTSTLQSPAHLYSSAGTYTVTLSAFTTLGCTNSVSHSITVNPSLAACLSLFNIAFDTTSTDPYAYTVYNLSYGSTLSYLWSFGDGTSSTLPNPTHVYGGGGPYQLCLTVDNSGGCTQMYCDSLMYVDSLSRTINQLSITVVDVNPPLASGIQENRFSYFVNAHPNPFSDNTTFIIQSNKSTETYSFEMTDVLGKKVKSINGITNKQFEISRAGLQNGIYFYKIYSSENVVGIGKLIVK